MLSRKAHRDHWDSYASFRKLAQSPEARQKRSQTILARISEIPFDEVGFSERKKRVIEEQQGKCLICGINEWNGKPVSLRLDHIDGDKRNNTRGNFRAICPNCDSQLSTYCGRNRRNQGKVTDEALLIALKDSSSISQALRKVGLSDTSGSYYIFRIVQLLDKNHALEHMTIH